MSNDWLNKQCDAGTYLPKDGRCPKCGALADERCRGKKDPKDLKQLDATLARVNAALNEEE